MDLKNLIIGNISFAGVGVTAKEGRAIDGAK